MLPTVGACYAYNAWGNRLESVKVTPGAEGTKLGIILEPLKSLIVIFGEADGELHAPIYESGSEIQFSNWARAICEGSKYPNFEAAKQVTLPDTLAQEQLTFSGFVRYMTKFSVDHTDGLCLVISDASEGVEVFVNGQSAGIQIAPPYRYDISAIAMQGENELIIEVATTLER